MSLISTDVRSKLTELGKLAEEFHEQGRKQIGADLYIKAAEAYKAVGNILAPVLNQSDSHEFVGEYDLNLMSFHYAEYFYHESTLAAYKLDHPQEQWDYQLLLAEQKEMFYHLDNAINAIHSPHLQLKADGQRIANDLHYFLLSEKSNEYQYRAMAEVAKRNFDDALDYYREQDRIRNEIADFIQQAEIRITNKRILEGNHITTRCNIAQMIIHSLIANDPSLSDATLVRVIKMELDTLSQIDTHFEVNPRATDLLEYQQQIEGELAAYLIENKPKWLELLIAFGDNYQLRKLMTKVDLDTYLKQRAKLALEKNKLKSFLLTGAFWLVAFCCVMYAALQIATAHITIVRFLATLLVAPVLMTILGAFILKSTDMLKEENFMKLITLALRINLKGLKWLNKSHATDSE